MCVLPIRTDDNCHLELFVHWPDSMPVPDRSGRETLHAEIGFVTDKGGRWELWFESDPHRRDKVKEEYPYYWSHLNYHVLKPNQKHKKVNVGMEDFSPLLISRQFPKYSCNETKLLPTLSSTETDLSIRQLRLNLKMDNWNHGIRTVDKIGYPRCQITRDKKTRQHFALIDPYSTAPVILRIIEQRIMHIPKKEIRDTLLEPLDKFIRYIAALDPRGFGQALSFCSARYVAALSLSIPEPARAECIYEIALASAQVCPVSSRSPCSDPAVIRHFLGIADDADLIGVAEIQALLIAENVTAARSQRRICDKLRGLGVCVVRHRRLKKAITVGDYRKHQCALSQHGNLRSSS